MAYDSSSAHTRSRVSGLDSLGDGDLRIRRELISVSDLCGGLDEIQDLLDDITVMGESQECIALERTGSRLTQQTWDSHQQPGQWQWQPPADPRADGVVCSWRAGRLLSPLGLSQVALMLLSVSCLTSVAVSGDPALGGPLVLPHPLHTRLAIFSCVFCLLWTALLLFVRVARLEYVLVINWTLLHTWLFCVVSALHAAATGLLLQQTYLYTYQYPALSGWTRGCTFSAAVASLLASGCALVVAFLPHCVSEARYSPLGQQTTRTTLLSTGDDWPYHHPQPASLSGSEADQQLQLNHYNPYIQWHVQNGTFYLLPAELRQQLPPPSQASSQLGGIT